MEATLGGATELTGKHFRLANARRPDGGLLFGITLPLPARRPLGFTGPSGIHPLVPLNVFSSVVTDENLLEHPASRRSLAMINQTAAPVTVVRSSTRDVLAADSFTIPPGALYFLYAGEGVQIHRLRGHSHG